MNTVAFAALGIGLFCWWLSGNWYAWAVTFAPIAIICLWAFVAWVPDPAWNPWLPLQLAAYAGGGWVLTGIPYYIRRRRGVVTIISP